MIKTNQHTLYTGITTDIDRRLKEHTQGQGAKYLKRFQTLQIVYQCKVADRSTASRLEASVKQCTKQQKLEIIRQQLNDQQLQQFLTSLSLKAHAT